MLIVNKLTLRFLFSFKVCWKQSQYNVIADVHWFLGEKNSVLDRKILKGQHSISHITRVLHVVQMDHKTQCIHTLMLKGRFLS
ncbi:unnamed protein product [Schistosoma guineensis]|nr:unnamed protein product [Schistosoma guineensis]